jgi:hemolysin III
MERAHREPVNGWLHFVGAVLALAGLAVLVAEARGQRSFRHLLAAVSFGATSTLLFGASALYHLRPGSRRASLYRRLDHAMIYIFIAGTYTAVCLVPLWDTVAGRVLLALVWLLAVAGVVVEALPKRPPRGVATALYLGLGWVGVVAAPTFARESPPGLLRWLFIGGLFYTAGAIVYWRKWPRGRPGVFGFHELWHACVVLASASHYWAVLEFLRPPAS